MEKSRREFLNNSIGALGLLVFSKDISSAFDRMTAGAADEGIFFSETDIPKIIKNTKLPFFKTYWESLINADLNADEKFFNQEFDNHNHVRHLYRAYDALKRSALVSMVENNEHHEKIARLAIEKILSFNEWDYFLEDGKEVIGFQRAPETTIAMCFALDCMRNKLSKKEKEDIINDIEKKGIPPCYLTLYGLRSPEKVKGWGFNPTSTQMITNQIKINFKRWPYFISKTNLMAIPIAGLSIGAFLLKSKSSEFKKWISLAEESLENFAPFYGKDGSYDENVSYWGYTTEHIILSVNMLRRVTGKKYNKLINFVGTDKFGMQMQAPFKGYPGANLNFGDVSLDTDASHSFWIAKEFNSGVSQYLGENCTKKRNHFAFLWYDESVKSSTPSNEMMDARFSNDWVVSRSGWTEMDTVIGLRSGGPANHEHADRNSIILNGFGERFFHDPYGASYFRTDKHWLLRLTEAHTAVLIDGLGHQYHDGTEGTNSSKAWAFITQYKPNKKITVVSSDATKAYRMINDDLKKIQRTFVFIKPDVLIMLDELEKIKNPSNLQARFQTFNIDGKAQIKTISDKSMFRIIRPNARMIACARSNTDISIINGKLDIPLEKGIFPFLEVSSEAEKEVLLVTACAMIPEAKKDDPQIIINKIEKIFRISVKFIDKQINLEVEMKPDYPRIKMI